IREGEHERQQRQQELTTAKVNLAQVEERHAAVRAKHRQIGSDLDQRRQERTQGEEHLVAAKSRLEESQRTMLCASAALARWYLDKEAAEHQVTQLTQDRDQKRTERHALAEKAQAARNEWRALKEQAHTLELEVNDLRHHSDTLAERLREDYQID